MENIKQQFNELRQYTVDAFTEYASPSGLDTSKERFEVMREYYSFCVTLTNIISRIDALTLAISQEISLSDERNDHNRTKELYEYFKIHADFRKTLEDFLQVTEQSAKCENDVFVQQLNLQAHLSIRRLLLMHIDF